MFPQMLLLIELAHNAAERIYRAIVQGDDQDKRLLPILKPYDANGATDYVDFTTAKPAYPTHPDKCHISHVVADTGSWEQKMAQALEEMHEVKRYVKNQNLGFTIPYTMSGQEKNYLPDFIVHVDLGKENGNCLNLIVEVSGQARSDKAHKVETARTLWIPAVNNHGGFGQWAFLEITDPWNAKNTIRAFLKANSDKTHGSTPKF